MELRRRRGLMITLILVTIGIPTIFLGVRLLLHAFAPSSYGPAGGENVFVGLAAVVLYVFGFIVAATLGCTAGSVDLTEGMFRHLVVTGRSRVALYLARVPAGLAIVVSLVAIGFTIVCLVCVFSSPTTLDYNGVNIPAGLSRTGLESWAANHVDEVVCNLVNGPNGPNVACSHPNSGVATMVRGSGGPGQLTPAQLRAASIQIARHDYSDYSALFLYPSDSLMIKTGLWIELEAVIAFVVGLGLGSLLGQRTIAVILMIVLEIILTPILSRAPIPHLLNLQRAVVGLAMAHLQPAALGSLNGGGGGPGGAHGPDMLRPESTVVAVCVIIAWLVVWTILGAWRMMTRDA